MIMLMTACGDNEVKPGSRLVGTWNLYSVTENDVTTKIPEDDPTKWASYTFTEDGKNCFYSTYNADGDASNWPITYGFPFQQAANILEIKGQKGAGVFDANIYYDEIGTLLVMTKYVDGKPTLTYTYKLVI